MAAAARPAASGSGAPAPQPVRGRVERTTGADLAGVRLHTDAGAARFAGAVGARACAFGPDVYFAAGEFRPGTRAGDRLLAHELVHTIQQRGARAARPAVAVSAPGDAAEVEADRIADRAIAGGPPATVSRSAAPVVARVVREDVEGWLRDPPGESDAQAVPEWGREYGNAPGADLARERKLIGNSKDSPAVRAASSFGGSKLDMSRPLDLADLEHIYIPKQGITKEDAAEVKKTLPSRLQHLNDAFRVMEIDTAEAQAAYIAHSYAESWQLRRMRAQADPAVVGQFVGRGPIQTTYRQGYIKSLAYLEAQAARLEQAGSTDPQKAADAKLARDALREIKRDPAAAEDPRYAFLLSGATMHAGGGVRSTARLKGVDPTFGGRGDEDRWVTGNSDIAGRLNYWTGLKNNGPALIAAADAAVQAETDPAKREHLQKAKDKLVADEPHAEERVKYWTGASRAAGRKDLAYDRAMDRLRPRIIRPAAAPPAAGP